MFHGIFCFIGGLKFNVSKSSASVGVQSVLWKIHALHGAISWKYFQNVITSDIACKATHMNLCGTWCGWTFFTFSTRWSRSGITYTYQFNYSTLMRMRRRNRSGYYKNMEIAWKFCSQMGLKIDHKKWGNRITIGTKSAHIFLKKPSLSLKITGINITCAAHFTTPLPALGFHTNSKTFYQYATFARCLLTLLQVSTHS